MSVALVPPARRVLVGAAFWLAVLAAVAVGLVSLRYLSGDPRMAGDGIRATMIANGWVFAVHAGASALALMLGGFQFVGGLRRRWPGLHRWGGRFYVAGCTAGAAAALWIAPDAEGGWLATLGFGLLALVWLYTTMTAWRLAVRRDFAAHRRWMIRSFALTFAAVTLRLQLAVFQVIGLGDYTALSPLLAFSAWIPNLLAVEVAFAIAAAKGRPEEPLRRSVRAF